MIGKLVEIFLCVDLKATVAADVKLFIHEVRGDTVFDQFGKLSEILGDSFGKVPLLPAVLQIDLDQFDESQTSVFALLGEKVGQRRRFCRGLPGIEKPLELARENI